MSRDMPLPILVPTASELLQLGLRVLGAVTRRKFRWQRTAATRSPPRVNGRGPSTQPTVTMLHAMLLARWRQRSLPWIADRHVRVDWKPRTSSNMRTLLRDAESALNRLLRRRSTKVEGYAGMLATLPGRYDHRRRRLIVGEHQYDELALLHCCMYWRGCSHPLLLALPPAHPATALVRWLSSFTAQQQVDHGNQILDELVDEERRVHEFALQLARRMLPNRGPATREVPLLPELLRAAEVNGATRSHLYSAAPGKTS